MGIIKPEAQVRAAFKLKISSKVGGTLCLLALAAAQVALALPLLAASQTECCTAALCATHQHKLPAPAKPNCHPAGVGLGNSSLQACHPQEHRATGLHTYLPPAPPQVTSEAPIAFGWPRIALFFPAPAMDTDSPPPRVAFG